VRKPPAARGQQQLHDPANTQQGSCKAARNRSGSGPPGASGAMTPGTRTSPRPTMRGSRCTCPWQRIPGAVVLKTGVAEFRCPTAARNDGIYMDELDRKLFELYLSFN